MGQYLNSCLIPWQNRLVAQHASIQIHTHSLSARLLATSCTSCILPSYLGLWVSTLALMLAVLGTVSYPGSRKNGTVLCTSLCSGVSSKGTKSSLNHDRLEESHMECNRDADYVGLTDMPHHIYNFH